MIRGNGSDAADVRWTIRGVPKAYADRATARAKRLDLAVGEVVCHALDMQEQADHQPVGITINGPADSPADAVADVEHLLAITREFAAHTGRPMRADVRKLGYDILAEKLSAVAPARPKRLPRSANVRNMPHESEEQPMP